MFLSLPIFTRLLSVYDFGVYNTYIAYEGILTAIIGLGLYGTVKNAKLDFKEKFNEYLSSVLFMSIIFLIILIFFLNSTYVLYAKAIGFSRLVMNFMIFQSYGSFLIYFYGAKLNIEFKYKSYILISFFNTMGNILLSVIFIKFLFPNQAYLGRILGTAFPLIIISIFLSCYIILKGKKIFDKKYWKYALVIGIPLVPHVISQSLLSQFDRIMINSMIGAAEAGIYSYVYTICTIMYIIAQSLDNAWSSWVYIKLDKNETNDIRKSFKTYVSLFTLLTIGFICVVPEVLKIVANNSYWDGINLLIPLTLSNYLIFLYMLTVGIEYYNKKTKFISLGTVTATIINVILNYIFIKILGYKAAAYTTLISYTLLFLFHWKISKRYNIEKIYEIKYILKHIVFLLIISGIISLTGITTILGLIIRYLLIVIILIYILKNKRVFINIIKNNKN